LRPESAAQPRGQRRGPPIAYATPWSVRVYDKNAEEYIVDSADEHPLKKPLTLIIHLPADQLQAGDAPDLAQAIHNYFAYRLDVTERRLRLYFRDGRITLLVGLIFLIVCIALRQLVLAVGGGLVAEIADEGLYILGWVVMWRPLEVFLYGWRPIWHRTRLYAKLARIPVIMHPT
jgi:hypothetical protein